MFCCLVFKEIGMITMAFFDILTFNAQLYRHKGKMRAQTRIVKS